jgi:pimeloyl-ACP methyl ester carboxylesterase
MAKVARFRAEDRYGEYVEAYDRALGTAAVNVREESVDTPYGTTHVLVAGDSDRPALVAHHGKALSSTMWLEHLDDLTASHRVFLVDTIGDMNKSQPTKVVGSRNEVVAWIDSLLDSLAIPQATFLGHSYGAWMATTYAIDRPQRVERLALLAPAAVFQQVHLMWLARAIWAHAVRPRTDVARRFITSGCAPSTVAALDTSAFGRVIDQYLVGVPAFKASFGDARPCTYSAEALAPLSMPVLVLVGRDETVCDGPRSAAVALERIPHATVEVLPEANHCVTADRPDLVTHALREFLSS